MKRSSSQELQSSPTSWEYISICLREGRQINCTYLQWTSKHYEKTRITIKNFITIFGRPVRLTLLPCYLRTRKQAVFSSATDQWWTDGESPPLLLSLPTMRSINRAIVQSDRAECAGALIPVNYSGTSISKRWAEAMGNIENSKTGRKVQRSSLLSPHHPALLSGSRPPRSLFLPLVIEPSVLLLVSIVNFQEWLQMLMMRLHILVVHIDIIEIPFFLKDLFCCTCQNQRRFSEQHVAFPADQLFSPAFIVSHSMHILFLISFIPQSGISRHFAAWN